MRRRLLTTILTGLFLPLAGGCGELFLNQTATLGGDSAGERGSVRVLFINNTPDRAVFTYGAYDQTDQLSGPDFAQFGLGDSARHLDGNSESSLASDEDESFVACARVFGIGSPELLRLMEENLTDVTMRDDALVEGVEFFQIGGEDGDDDSAEPQSSGFAAPFEALLGVDFSCGSLLIVRFEVNDVEGDWPYRIDFEIVPADSER